MFRVDRDYHVPVDIDLRVHTLDLVGSQEPPTVGDLVERAQQSAVLQRQCAAVLRHLEATAFRFQFDHHGQPETNWSLNALPMKSTTRDHLGRIGLRRICDLTNGSLADLASEIGPSDITQIQSALQKHLRIEIDRRGALLRSPSDAFVDVPIPTFLVFDRSTLKTPELEISLAFSNLRN